MCLKLASPEMVLISLLHRVALRTNISQSKVPTMLRLRDLGFVLNTRGLLSTTLTENLILSNAAKTLKSGPFLSS